MTGSFRLRIGIISVVIGGHFGGGDHFDGGDHFGGGTGKRDSRRHSTTSFSENVEVAETSYQMLEVLSFCHQERV